MCCHCCTGPRIYPEDEVLVIVPGWDTQQEVRIAWKDRPPFELEEGQRLHARVNLGARAPEELTFSEWEPC